MNIWVNTHHLCKYVGQVYPSKIDQPTCCIRCSHINEVSLTGLLLLRTFKKAAMLAGELFDFNMELIILRPKIVYSITLRKGFPCIVPRFPCPSEPTFLFIYQRRKKSSISDVIKCCIKSSSNLHMHTNKSLKIFLCTLSV